MGRRSRAGFLRESWGYFVLMLRRPVISIARAAGLALVAAVWLTCGGARGHVFVPEMYREGGYPAYDGAGWVAKVYLNLPLPDPPEDTSATDLGTLIQAESYVADATPDFTFRTDWIDFPAGPEAVALDTSFTTMGDFLNDYIYDVSDPSKLDEPFGNFLIKFEGYLKVTFDEDLTSAIGLPIWVDFGTIGYDGFRLEVGTTIYRFPKMFVVDGEPSFFWRENPICEAAGMFPIRVTYYNRYDADLDPDPPTQQSYHNEYAGIEVYTWHGSELALPAGQNMVHAVRGPGTIIPPRVIYQADDVQPLVTGDFTADGQVDGRDLRWFQTCFTGPGDELFVLLATGCHRFDFDEDRDVDLTDFATFLGLLESP